MMGAGVGVIVLAVVAVVVAIAFAGEAVTGSVLRARLEVNFHSARFDSGWACSGRRVSSVHGSVRRGLAARTRATSLGSTVEAPLSQRARATREFSVPLVFSYENDRGASEWSAVLGLFHYRGTNAAWRFRLLWLIRFGRGDEDRLLESGS